MTLLLVGVFLAAALIGGSHSEGVCLQDGRHKARPSPEPQLRICSLYADSECLAVKPGRTGSPDRRLTSSCLHTGSCCSEEDVQDVSTVDNQNEPWDKCGPLSSE